MLTQKLFISYVPFNMVMEFKSVSAKMPIHEVNLFKAFCEKKGVSPASLIRELILREMDVPIPHTVAGKNRIVYNKERDTFNWSVELDIGKEIDVMRDVSSGYLEDLHGVIELGLDERSTFIGKVRKNSVPVPFTVLRGKQK